MYEYTRARSGINWDKLMREKAFVASMSASRWVGYSAVLDDLLLLLEGRLRPAAPADRLVLCRNLAQLRSLVRQRHVELTHDKEGAQEALLRRLEAALSAPPASAEAISKNCGAAVFAALPLDRSVTKNDVELVTNSVRFLFARFASDLEKLLDVERARAVLLAA